MVIAALYRRRETFDHWWLDFNNWRNSKCWFRRCLFLLDI